MANERGKAITIDIGVHQNNANGCNPQREIQRTLKFQKLNICTSANTCNNTSGYASSSHYENQGLHHMSRPFRKPARNLHSRNMYKEHYQETGNTPETATPKKFLSLCIRKDHVKDGLKECQNNLIEKIKIVSQKLTPKSTLLQNALLGISCNPLGLAVENLTQMEA